MIDVLFPQLLKYQSFILCFFKYLVIRNYRSYLRRRQNSKQYLTMGEKKIISGKSKFMKINLNFPPGKQLYNCNLAKEILEITFEILHCKITFNI